MSLSAARPARAIRPLAWPAMARLQMPASKSETNRLLILAAQAGQRVLLRNLTRSDDVLHLTQGLATLGHGVHWQDDDGSSVAIEPRASGAPSSGELFCGNAGTALRFLLSLAVITPGEWTIDGDARMRERPIGPLVAAWRQLGAVLEDTNGCPPVRVRGTQLAGGAAELDASISSQFVSSLLLVGSSLPLGLRLRWPTELTSADYAEWTVALLRRFGVAAELGSNQAYAPPAALRMPSELMPAGDWSSMGAWTCLAFLTGSSITASNLPESGHQADARLAPLLQQLRGTAPVAVDLRSLPDQFLNFAATAALRPGRTVVRGGYNLRRKECDRIAVMARELRQLGVAVTEHDDALVIDGGPLRRGACIDPAGDHRVAMAFAMLGLVAPGIAITDPGCVAKSYPDFFADLERLHQHPRCVAVIGMRAAGKTSFGAALAAATGCRHVDSDAEFVRRHGAISNFVADHGWPRFRELEAQVIGDSLAPGCILSTGGGAIETQAVADLLRQQALVVWLDAPLQLLQQRLARDPDRPSLTGAPPATELAKVLEHRLPIYRDLATIRIASELTMAEQIEQARRLLRAPCRHASPSPGGP